MELIRELKDLSINQTVVLFDATLTAFVLCRCSELDVETQQLELERIQGVFAKDLPLPPPEANKAPSQILTLREGERVLHYIGFDSSEGEAIINNSKIKLFTTDGLPLTKETL
jgi:hypothetical protein